MVKYTFLFLTLFPFYNSNSYADVVQVGSYKCEPYTYEPDKSFDLNKCLYRGDYVFIDQVGIGRSDSIPDSFTPTRTYLNFEGHMNKLQKKRSQLDLAQEELSRELSSNKLILDSYKEQKKLITSFFSLYEDIISLIDQSILTIEHLKTALEDKNTLITTKNEELTLIQNYLETIISSDSFESSTTKSVISEDYETLGAFSTNQEIEDSNLEDNRLLESYQRLLVVLMQENLILTNKLNKLNLKIENLEDEVSKQSCKVENLNEEIESYIERIISLKEFTSKCTR